MPPEFQPYEIGDEYVLGVGRDSLNVEYVKMFRLRAAG